LSDRRGNGRTERRVTPSLPAGERFVAAFQAGEGIAATLAFRYRVVVVTDRQIHVYSAKLWRVCDPGRLLSSHPHGAMVARPAQPLTLAREIYIGDRRLWVRAAFQRELADALLAATGRGL
jgi:hypothetical protein